MRETDDPPGATQKWPRAPQRGLCHGRGRATLGAAAGTPLLAV